MKASLFLLPSLLIVGLSAWMPPAAIAGSETCKNVNITLQNDTKDDIKVTKLEYYDFDNDQYRTETGIFGPSGNLGIFEGNNFPINKRDLEKVNNESTKIRVTYRQRSGNGNKYGSSKTETTPTFTCTSGMPKEVVLDN